MFRTLRVIFCALVLVGTMGAGTKILGSADGETSGFHTDATQLKSISGNMVAVTGGDCHWYNFSGLRFDFPRAYSQISGRVCGQNGLGTWYIVVAAYPRKVGIPITWFACVPVVQSGVPGTGVNGGLISGPAQAIRGVQQSVHILQLTVLNGAPLRLSIGSVGYQFKTVPIGQSALSIYTAAQAAINTLCTSNVPGTGGGNYGCAYAVNAIVQKATGAPVGGGLSTTDMYQALQQHARAAAGKGCFATAVSQAAASPGTIIISPTTTIGGSLVHGHVGICMTDGCTKIASNSSSAGCFKQNFTLESWKTAFKTNKGLPVLFYNIQ